MSILFCASIIAILAMSMVYFALSSRCRFVESLHFTELSAAMVEDGDVIINVGQSDDSLDWAYASLLEAARIDANHSTFRPEALTWEPTVVLTCSEKVTSQGECSIEPFILELEALAIAQPLTCSEPKKPHQLMEFYPLPPPLEYSFDRILTEGNECSDEIDDLSTHTEREEEGDTSPSHQVISDALNVLDDLDDVLTLNLELAETAVDCRSEEYDIPFSVNDDSEGSVYSEFVPQDSINSDNEYLDMPYIVQDDSEGSVYSEHESENSNDSNLEGSLPGSPILTSSLQPSGTQSNTPHSSSSFDLQAHARAIYPVHRTPFDSEPPVMAPPQLLSKMCNAPPSGDTLPEKIHYCGTYPAHRTPFDSDSPVLGPPAPVSRGQEAILEASKEFAAKHWSRENGLDLGDTEHHEDLPGDSMGMYHQVDSEDCQSPLRPTEYEPRKCEPKQCEPRQCEPRQCEPRPCETRRPSDKPHPVSLASILAGRREKIRFNKPEPLLDYLLIRERIPSYAPPYCEARIQKIYDTLAPLPEQCKPADESHKSSKLFVYQSREVVRNYTEFLEQCRTQLGAVKREIEKVAVLETLFIPKHRKLGKEIIRSIDLGIEEISEELSSSHKDLVSDVNIISQKRHMPTRFLARAASRSWRGVANDVAYNVEMFLEERDTKALMLLGKVSTLMRDSEVYTHNLILERHLSFRRYTRLSDQEARTFMQAALNNEI